MPLPPRSLGVVRRRTGRGMGDVLPSLPSIPSASLNVPNVSIPSIPTSGSAVINTYANVASSESGALSAMVNGYAGAATAAGSAYLNSAEQYALQQLSATSGAILQSLPTGMQNALASGQTVVGAGTAAFNLATKISSQGGLTEANEVEVVAGLAAVIGAVNPIAGAAVAAAGAIVIGFQDALKGIFSSLGLYTHPEPTWDYIGLVRQGTDVVPNPPSTNGDSDPLWMRFNDFFDVPWNDSGNVPFNIQSYPYSPSPTTVDRDKPYYELLACAILRRQNPTHKLLDRVFTRTYPQGQDGHQNPGTGVIDDLTWVQILAATPTAFERYFNTLLVQNLTYWANGNAYVPPRQLLQAAVGTWNVSHGGAPVRIAAGPTLVGNTGQSAFTLLASGGASVPYSSTIEWILGPSGSLVGGSQQPASGGVVYIKSPDGSNDFNAPASAASTGGSNAVAAAIAPVAATALAIPVGIGLGAVAYSLILGQARDAALRRLWWMIASRF